MKRLTILLIVLALVLMALPMANAQGTAGDGVLEFGETERGEISNETFEVEYTFTGTAGQVVVIQMLPVDEFGDLSSPGIILLDSANTVLGAHDTFGNLTFAAQLPADGDYTVIATRRDGRSGDSFGEYDISLFEPPVLADGETLEGSVSSETTAFFAYSTMAPFELAYNITTGDFNPAVYVNVIDEDGRLDEVIRLEGEQLVGGSVIVQPESETVATTYVITVTEGFFDFNFDEVNANYTLTVTAQ